MKMGGPVYRIGVGGGAASSVEVSNAAGSDAKSDITWWLNLFHPGRSRATTPVTGT